MASSNMSIPDAINILLLGPAPTEHEINKSYRAMAKRYHPDKHMLNNEGDYTRKMQDLNMAKDVLTRHVREQPKDDDQTANDNSATHPFTPSVFEQDPTTHGRFTHVEDIISEDPFTSNFNRPGRIPMEQIVTTLSIKEEDIKMERRMHVPYIRRIACGACEGTGAAAQGWEMCPACRKSRELIGCIRHHEIKLQDGKPGFVIVECRVCDGRGQINKIQCVECERTGSRPQEATASIQLTKKSRPGDIFGQFEAGHHALDSAHRNGDVFITLISASGSEDAIGHHTFRDRIQDEVHIDYKSSGPECKMQ